MLHPRPGPLKAERSPREPRGSCSEFSASDGEAECSVTAKFQVLAHYHDHPDDHKMLFMTRE